MEKKIDTRDLRLGMYISDLDRPWVETPFMFQGFSLTATDDIRVLQEHCRFVYIDVDQGEDSHACSERREESATPDVLMELCHRPNGFDFYQDQLSVEEELAVARDTHRQAQETLYSVIEDTQSGRPLSLSGVNQSVDGLIDSVLRNPDAFLWLTQLEQKDAYAYAHAISACTLSVAFGRHMGFPREELRHIAVGSLLFDIGKMKLPQELLDKPGRLTEREFELIKEHVTFGVKLLSSHQGFHRSSLNVLQSHHERFDGTGYPHRLSGTQIPVYARMAAIVDCYAAITSTRPYRCGLSPHVAVRKLYDWRDVDFQEELVEQFIQCLGVYPTGTLVRLSNHEVAIVIAQNRLRRLRPRIMVILDAQQQRLTTPCSLDLQSHPELEILDVLDPEHCSIDTREFYL